MRRRRSSLVLILANVAVAVLLMLVTRPAEAVAQAATDPQPRPANAQQETPSKRWEIQVYGGLAKATIPADGRAALPDPGPPIPTSSPTFSTRRVPSWFFGDGAALLNDVNAQFGVPARVASLDPVLTSLGLDYGTLTTLGVRLRRAVTPSYSAEISVDLLAGSAGLDDELVSAAALARDSFVAAMTGLLAEGPFTNAVVDARSSTIHGSSREVAITAAVHQRFTERAGFVPYATFGGGVLSGTGDLPSISLVANYRFTILNEVPIDETDRATLRYTNRAAFVAVLGGGVKRSMAGGWGLQADGRVLLGPNRARLLIDASPFIARGTPADAIETVTSPGIQFSNDPATGRSSTLSGSLDGFEAFVGRGVQTRFLITVGVFMQF